MVYSNISSSIRPIPHGEGLPTPEPPKEYHIISDEDEEEISGGGSPEFCTSKDPDFLANIPSNESHRLTQNELSDFIRDLGLSESNAEILASRLQQWTLL